jgi:hypothetical protein
VELSGYGVRETSAALSIFSLTEYDRIRDNTTPNVGVSVFHTVGVRKDPDPRDAELLLNTRFVSADDKPVHLSIAWKDLKTSAALASSLDFQALGSGEISVVASLKFIPFDVLQFPVYRGLLVSKVVQEIDPSTNQPHGPHLHLVQNGAIVQITIQVTSPDALSSVLLVDLLPGGLEAIDPLLDSDSVSGGKNNFDGDSRFGGGWYPRFYSSTFGAQETRPDRVQYTATYFSAGVHTVSYKAIAATNGAFVLPPAKAFVQEQPELMGLSAGGGLIVQHETVDSAEYTLQLKAHVEGLTKFDGAPLPPIQMLSKSMAEERFGVKASTGRALLQDCQGGCPHGGVCNIARGTCQCYANYQLVEGDCKPEVGGDQNGGNEDHKHQSLRFNLIIVCTVITGIGVLLVIKAAQKLRSRSRNSISDAGAQLAKGRYGRVRTNVDIESEKTI